MAREYMAKLRLTIIFTAPLTNVFFSVATVPHIQLLSRHHPARPAKNQRKRAGKNFPPRIHPQFSTGGYGWFTQKPESTQAFPRDGEKDFFAREVNFVEAADRKKILTRGEEKRAGAEVESEIQRSKDAEKDSAPKRNVTISSQPRAAAGATALECFNCAAHVFRSDPGIGIDKNKNVAARGGRSGITRGCNLSALDRNHARPEFFADCARRVGRSIVHQHNLVLITGSGRTNGAERSRQFRFFVISRHNERNDNSGSRRLSYLLGRHWTQLPKEH